MLYSSNYKKYQSRNFVKKYLLKKFIYNILKIIFALKQINNILDAGCGEGFIMQKIIEINPKINIVGLDISLESLEMGKKINPNLKFIYGDITKMPYKDNAFDLILALEVLEHLPNPRVAFLELKRVTRKYCLISVPWEPFFSWGNLLSGKNIIRGGRDPEHINLWRRAEIINLINQFFKIKLVKISFPWIIVLAKK